MLLEEVPVLVRGEVSIVLAGHLWLEEQLMRVLEENLKSNSPSSRRNNDLILAVRFVGETAPGREDRLLLEPVTVRVLEVTMLKCEDFFTL